MRFVYVVVLKNVRGSQTRQKSDERQRHADERQFTYAQVEEQQHVFKRIVRRFVAGLYGGLGDHIWRARVNTAFTQDCEVEHNTCRTETPAIHGIPKR